MGYGESFVCIIAENSFAYGLLLWKYVACGSKKRAKFYKFSCLKDDVANLCAMAHGINN